jgi:hypothetical protein
MKQKSKQGMDTNIRLIKLPAPALSGSGSKGMISAFLGAPLLILCRTAKKGKIRELEK